jgi:NAD(P)-dependent dehydrogenase (short-subunit alcohol dehydrogenase family)
MGDQVIEMLKEVTEMGGNEARSLLTEMHPMGKLGTPQDIASMALFLASNESSFITGAEMLVDGGFVAK